MTKQDILFFALLVLFIITIVITLLGVTKVIEIDEFYLKGLFGSFLIELAAVVFNIVKKGNLLEDAKNESKTPSNIADSTNKNSSRTSIIATVGLKPSEYVQIKKKTNHLKKTEFGSIESIINENITE